MNVFSHYCLTFSANDCVFSLNEQQKVYIVLATLTRVNWDWGHSMFYGLFALFVSGQT